MKGQDYIKTRKHTKQMVYHRPTRLSNTINTTVFDSFYEDISDDWQERAKRLRMRRWHKIRQQTT